MIKINPLDAHDRLKHFKKQRFSISECCQDLIDKKPFGNHAFYIFAHARTEDNGIDKRLIWQPRLTKPLSQTNSMLFKVYPGTDQVKVLWIIPSRELWDQYQKGKLSENKTVCQSIHDFENNRQFLDKPEEDDLPDERIRDILKDIILDAKRSKMISRLYV